jgi:hypothetical protein
VGGEEGSRLRLRLGLVGRYCAETDALNEESRQMTNGGEEEYGTDSGEWLDPTTAVTSSRS